MTITPALLILCLTLCSTLSAEEVCEDRIECPCGDTGKNITICAKATDDEPCQKLSRCKSCEDGLNSCSKCPDGFEGLFCSTDVMCHDPGQIANADRFNADGSLSLSHHKFRVGESVIYTCHPGFALQLRSRITCLPSGTWSSTTPYCMPGTPLKLAVRSAAAEYPKTSLRYCVDFGTDPNGNRQPTPPNVKGYPQGSHVEYSCNNGYNLIGEKNLLCLFSGDWSANPPRCEAKSTNPGLKYCTDPGTVPHSSRQLRSSSSGPEFPQGTLLEYSCNEGYELFGDRILFCLLSGEWSSNRPRCEAQTPYPGLKLCVDPGNIPNGNRQLRSSYNGCDFPQGSLLEYSCNKGYDLIGERILFCLLSGEWSANPPRCEAKSPNTGFKLCVDPGTIPNGIRQQRTPSDGREFPVGSLLDYSCNEGYELIGKRMLFCLLSGEWSADRPRCEDTLKSCRSLDPILNGTVVYYPPLSGVSVPFKETKEFSPGSRLRYSCNSGYVLRGTSVLTCYASGIWSADPPKCINVTENFYCFNLGPIANGRVKYLVPGSRKGNRPEKTFKEDLDEYPAGTRLEYSCDEGFRLEGAGTITCKRTMLWSETAPTCIEDCGRSFAQAIGRVTYGSRLIPGEWPWVVSISIAENDNLVCGGALLNGNTVITAAQCLKLSNSFILRFGKYHSNVKDDDEEVLIRKSKRVIIHPGFNSSTFDSDIGLVTFEPSIRLSIRVQPICLPTVESTTENLKGGSIGYVAGWGVTEASLAAEELKLASLPYMTNEACVESYRKQNQTPTLTKNMFCAGHEKEQQSLCEGDGGSALAFYNPSTNRYTLEGIVSFTMKGQCGLPGRYTIFTKVYNFVPWIFRNWK